MHNPNPTKQQKDPVCGCSVDAGKSTFKTLHNNKQYSFCCKNCQDEFKKHPQKYAK